MRYLNRLIILLAAAACLFPLAPPARAAQYSPGQFLTVQHKSISAGSTQNIVFEGAGGYSVTVPTSNTTAGKALVAVPPYVDLSALDFPASQLSATLSGADWNQVIDLTAPSSPDGVSPAEFMALVKEHCIANLQEAAGAFRSAGGEVSLQPSIDAMNAQIGQLQDEVNQIRSKGSITLSDGGQTYTIIAGQLDRAGQLAYGALAGMSQAVQAQAAGFFPSRTDAEWRQWLIDLRDKELSDTKKATVNLLTGLETQMHTIDKARDWFEGNDPKKFEQFATVASPLVRWAQVQMIWTISVSFAYVGKSIPGRDLAEIGARIGMVQQVVAAVQILHGFDNQKPYDVYLGLNMWVKSMNRMLDNMNKWYDEMVGGDEGGGEGELTGNLERGWWEQKVYYHGDHLWTLPIIFRNGIWGHRDDPDLMAPYGTYSVSGNSVNMQIYDAETYYSGTFSSTTRISGVFHQLYEEANMDWTADWKGQ